ncbi:CysB family HTH-type transcriptional regulator [Ideonella azotifigens]|uniref:CysB family HTH-type transcriptional regulator n=1 Tax=Ideonella azotifigens TaxID=513160 RepID=A0ABN1JNE9_9BURK|nr:MULTISPECIES: CysB family HTH-type transcriptional regulator [Ideonella]MCD2339940.1 CysB family HTH-type transcriptional regulator [Ideonella azotifigens]HSI50406.1 CysB family HTH-type transcriptional regulator [Ideonella sp.]
MNFQQLRSVREAVRRGFNLTDVAEALHTSQPGISRQIRELEDELGVEIFVRAGKRLTGLTPAGERVLPWVERLLLDAENLHRAGEDFRLGEVGMLSIAATHSQARYALPGAVHDFRSLHPKVQLQMHQGSPDQIAQMLLTGQADIGIASHVLADNPELVALPCYRWTHSVVVPVGHALLDQPLTLERLAEHPVITYETGLTGRGSIDDAFSRAGLAPRVVLTAMDADVIKTYVELGLGVGIMASIAYDEARDTQLRAIEARSLFSINTTSVAVRRGGLLRSYAYDFIQTFAPHLQPDVVRQAQAAPVGTPEAPL